MFTIGVAITDEDLKLVADGRLSLSSLLSRKREAVRVELERKVPELNVAISVLRKKDAKA